MTSIIITLLLIGALAMAATFWGCWAHARSLEGFIAGLWFCWMLVLVLGLSAGSVCAEAIR